MISPSSSSSFALPSARRGRTCYTINRICGESSQQMPTRLVEILVIEALKHLKLKTGQEMTIKNTHPLVHLSL